MQGPLTPAVAAGVTRQLPGDLDLGCEVWACQASATHPHNQVSSITLILSRLRGSRKGPIFWSSRDAATAVTRWWESNWLQLDSRPLVHQTLPGGFEHRRDHASCVVFVAPEEQTALAG